MPCICGKSVKKPSNLQCKVRYCLCGRCNHCHKGGFCPISMTWYTKKNKKIPNQKLDVRYANQSRGGHNFIPECPHCN
jgi:hypothetical protein